MLNNNADIIQTVGQPAPMNSSVCVFESDIFFFFCYFLHIVQTLTLIASEWLEELNVLFVVSTGECWLCFVFIPFFENTIFVILNLNGVNMKR